MELTLEERQVTAEAIRLIRSRLRARTLELVDHGEVVLLFDIEDVLADAIASLEVGDGR